MGRIECSIFSMVNIKSSVMTSATTEYIFLGRTCEIHFIPVTYDGTVNDQNRTGRFHSCLSLLP